MAVKYLMVSKTPSAREHTVVNMSDDIRDSANNSLAVKPMKVENRVLTAPEIIAKRLTLAAIPISPTNVSVLVIGGGAAVYGTDFNIVSTQQLNWSSLGLEPLLSVGDTLQIQYDT